MSHRIGEGTVVEKQASRVKPPPMYQVVLLNDDFTPMEFVVSVLQKFFGKGREQPCRVRNLSEGSGSQQVRAGQQLF
jgi:ATP-dependent Clp protease adaptor protein ClpS